uniref:Uncharacterized protein n=1 Tax=Siphoviridae sp. ctrgQ8 TaxID=2825689 RepID=A0A8S5PNY3_9CAUD|nr:MAG TPA: hypothetical protein [Siphoviridae sp. ctrgQ8]
MEQFWCEQNHGFYRDSHFYIRLQPFFIGYECKTNEL